MAAAANATLIYHQANIIRRAGHDAEIFAARWSLAAAGKFCDVRFVLKDGASVGAHQIILRQVSKFWAELVDTHVGYNEVVTMSIPSVSKEQLSVVLELLYTGKCVINRGDLMIWHNIFEFLHMDCLNNGTSENNTGSQDEMFIGEHFLTKGKKDRIGCENETAESRTLVNVGGKKSPASPTTRNDSGLSDLSEFSDDDESDEVFEGNRGSVLAQGFSCYICDETFVTKNKLQRHLIATHFRDSILEKNIAAVGSDKICCMCQKNCRSRHETAEHLSLKHNWLENFIRSGMPKPKASKISSNEINMSNNEKKLPEKTSACKDGTNKISEAHVLKMKAAFSKNQHPSTDFQKDLAVSMNLSYEKVNSWFRAHRFLLKKQISKRSPKKQTEETPKSRENVSKKGSETKETPKSVASFIKRRLETKEPVAQVQQLNEAGTRRSGRLQAQMQKKPEISELNGNEINVSNEKKLPEETISSKTGLNKIKPTMRLKKLSINKRGRRQSRTSDDQVLKMKEELSNDQNPSKRRKLSYTDENTSIDFQNEAASIKKEAYEKAQENVTETEGDVEEDAAKPNEDDTENNNGENENSAEQDIIENNNSGKEASTNETEAWSKEHGSMEEIVSRIFGAQ